MIFLKEKFVTNSPGQTKKLAEKITSLLLRYGFFKQAAVVALSGDLGSGKTTFVQGLAPVLGIKEKIASPTFVVMKRFVIETTARLMFL